MTPFMLVTMTGLTSVTFFDQWCRKGAWHALAMAVLAAGAMLVQLA
ncbi:hypothetical protein [Actibacterium lipolyticum]|uniref:Uncharacterized protein n=1 Tax=Actibacterium lipolyticum TaxID=1524263 RepID=A0A238KIG4_9RHOB|nr:hypothetical protein [Actibacterium lipolyticum]SMX42601.1 hypothetical protein COL8621_02024 [Actibacterium lipolyticum]